MELVTCFGWQTFGQTKYIRLVVPVYWCCFNHLHVGNVGRGSVVGIATRYDLDGPVIKFRW
jgi:hypothetical protein